MKRYAIWCEVSGGVTGHRCGWAKCNGVPITRATQAEAEAEARQLSERMNGNPNRTADYSYTVRPYSG